MKHLVQPFLSVLVLLLASGVARPAGALPFDPAGHWQGAILVRPGEYEIDLDLTLERCGERGWCGHLVLPTENSSPLDVLSIEVQGAVLSFRTRDAEGVDSEFKGTFSSDGQSIEGVIFEKERQAPFTLARAEQASTVRASVKTLSESGSELRETFNQDRGKVRLLLILSPTCSNCRMSARLVQRYVLAALNDPRLAVYVVWEKIGSKDSLETALQATALLPDPRVNFFWSSERIVGKIFQKTIGIQGTPAWDVFLVFDTRKEWPGSPPSPDYLMHNQPAHSELPQDRLLNANRLVEKVRNYLQENGTASLSEVNVPTPSF
ncbi:MAG TPA: hypothetical protein VF173_02485 [Thermoanaerobaculia bacterium]|nr:hypothetical protein [Thermoanaerobaculia bacterium]